MSHHRAEIGSYYEYEPYHSGLAAVQTRLSDRVTVAFECNTVIITRLLPGNARCSASEPCHEREAVEQ